MVKNPVEYCTCQDIVAQDLAPFTEVLVRGEDGRVLFVPVRYHLEKEIGSFPVQGKVANLIDHKQLWP